MSEWDEFESALKAQQTTIRNMDATVMQAGADDDKLAMLFEQIEEMMAVLKAQKQTVVNQLAAGVREDIGEFERITPNGRYRIIVGWPEKFEWDEEKLKEIAGEAGGALPAFLDKTIKVDKRAWARADNSERAPYIPALTVKTGTRSVKVEVAG